MLIGLRLPPPAAPFAPVPDGRGIPPAAPPLMPDSVPRGMSMLCRLFAAVVVNRVSMICNWMVC
jgi:hypothetical protein